MVDLVDFKNLFKSWGRTKNEDKEIFENELSKLKYEKGKLYWED